MMRIARAVNLVLVLAATGWGGLAGTLRVPGEYPTIGAALDAASPGDVIEVAAGVYTEDLVITKSVVVRGELVVLMAGAKGSWVPLFPWELETGVRIVGSEGRSETVLVRGDARVTLEFLTVSGGRSAALAAAGEARLALNHVTVLTSGGMGVWVQDSAHTTLDRCVVARHPTHGILALGSAEVSIQDSVLAGNGGAALVVDGGSRAQVTGSMFYRNVTGLDVGGGRAVVGDSVFWGNGEGVRVGRGGLQLSQCTIWANGVGIIVTAGPARLVLEDNLIAGNRGDGVLLFDRVCIVAVANRIVRNGGYGLRLHLPACPSEPAGRTLPPVALAGFWGEVSGGANYISGPEEPDGNFQGGPVPGDPRLPVAGGLPRPMIPGA